MPHAKGDSLQLVEPALMTFSKRFGQFFWPGATVLKTTLRKPGGHCKGSPGAVVVPELLACLGNNPVGDAEMPAARTRAVINPERDIMNRQKNNAKMSVVDQ